MKTSFAISKLVVLVMVLFPLCGHASIASGNWYLQASSQQESGVSRIPQIGGSLTQTDSLISGVLHVSDSECFDWSTGIPVSGTLDGNTVTLVSDGANGAVVTIKGVATSSSAITGTYSIASGCGDGDYGTFTAVLVAPVTGGWTGSYLSSGAANAATASLSQATPNAAGYSALTGTVAISGSQCSLSGALVEGQSWILGNVVQAVAEMSDGSMLSITGFVTGENAANQITMNFSISGGKCSGQSGSVTYNRAAAN